MTWVLMNRQIVPAERAQVPALSRALLYGDGLFETLRAYHGRLFDLDRHLDRIERSAAELGLPLVWDRQDLRGRLQDLVTAAGAPDAYVRLTLCRGVGPDESFWFAHSRPLEPREQHAADNPLRLSIATVRQDVTYPWHRHKTLHYAWRWHVRSQAQAAGADDALLLNSVDELAETTTANVFLVAQGAVHTPSLSANILPGIVRTRLLEIGPDVGVTCLEQSLRVADLAGAQEVFLSNSLREVVPVREVIGHWRGSAPGPVTSRLLEAYRELVARELNLS